MILKTPQKVLKPENCRLAYKDYWTIEIIDSSIVFPKKKKVQLRCSPPLHKLKKKKRVSVKNDFPDVDVQKPI